MRSPIARFRLVGETGRNVLTLFTGNALSQAVNLASIPILTRIYDPTGFGILAAYVASATLASVLSTGRYHLAIVIPESDLEASQIRAIGHRIAVLTSAAALAILVACMNQVAQLTHMTSFPLWVPTMALNIYLLGRSELLNYWYTRARNFKVQSQARFLLAVATFAAQAALGTYWANDARGLILGLLIGQMVSVSYLTIPLRGSLDWKHLTWGTTKQLLKRYIKMPLLNGPNAFVDAARINGINLIVGATSTQTLGHFSMALRTVQAPVSLIAQSISQVFLQSLARETPGHLYASALSIVRRSLILGILPFSVLFITSPWIFPLLLGPGWEDSGLYAQALAPWLLLNVASSPLANVFILTRTQGRLLIFAIVYMITPLSILSYLRKDLLLAVWATSIAMSLLLICQISLALWTARTEDLRRTVID